MSPVVSPLSSGSGFTVPRRLPGLHGLRALAACAIVMLHTIRVPQPWLTVPHGLARVVPHLWSGVTLFFVLSAFSLLYSNVGIVGARGWVVIYLIKRFFRIAPLFYAMLALYIIFAAMRGYYFEPLNIVANILFVFNFAPGWHQSIVWAGWTVGVEMPFYLSVPLILVYIRTTRRVWLLVALTAVISTASRIILSRASNIPSDLPDIALTSNLLVFALGVLAFHVATRSTPGWLRPTLIVFSIAGLLALSLDAISVLDPDGPLDTMAFALPLTTLCIWQALWPSGWLAGRPLQWLGERSYGVYLLHPFIVFQLSRQGIYSVIDAWSRPLTGDWSFLVDVALTLILAAVGAAICYRLIERSGQRIGASLARHCFGPGSGAEAKPLAPAVLQ
jgi:peptidoglycan/LPS O-acetylase OafA/YrhL